MKNKGVLALAICVVLAGVLLSLGWLNPARDHGVKDARYLSQAQWDQTIAECTRAIESDPALATAYNDRGYAYAQKGNYDKAIAIDPYYTTAYYNRGFAYRAIGETGKAEADFLVAGYTR